MGIVRQLAVVAHIGLLAAAGSARADAPTVGLASNAAASAAIVDVARTADTGSCAGASPRHARTLADQAFRNAAFQRAAACYLAAGEPAFANEAFLKAAAQVSVDTSQKLATNADEVKLQISQLKQAFRHR